jgi:hypothetical protein
MTTTSILFTCPECKVQGKAKPEWVGRKLRCPRCGIETEIAAPEAEVLPEPSAEVTPEVADETPDFGAQLPEPAAPSEAQTETVHDFPDPVPTGLWEYRIVRHTSSDPLTLIDEIMSVGNEGWECVGVLQRKVLLYTRLRK